MPDGIASPSIGEGAGLAGTAAAVSAGAAEVGVGEVPAGGSAGAWTSIRAEAAGAAPLAARAPSVPTSDGGITGSPFGETAAVGADAGRRLTGTPIRPAGRKNTATAPSSNSPASQ